MNISARTFTYVLTAFIALIGHNVTSEPSLEVGRIPPLPPARALMERLPLFFEIPGERSRGFVARGPGYVVRLGPDEVSLDTPAAHGVAPTSLRMRLVGARVDAVGEPLEAIPGKLHELRGSSPEQWRLGIASFVRLRFTEVYPGVDVEYYGNRGRLEYDFRLVPGISPARIRLRFEGASDLKIDDEGALVMQVAGATVRQPPPYAYQEIGGSRHPVEASFVIRDPMEVGFVVKGQTPSLPLVIDPVIIYSELLGGSGADTAYDVVTDHDGLVYMVGATESADFPIDNASQSESAGRRDVFVMKFDPGTGFLYYVTYLGGSADDIGYAVETDDAGNAYVVGSTRSADFPTLAPFQGSLRGSADAFITKLDFEGLPLFSTYLGGDALDIALDVAVDVAGRVHLAGTTRSSNFPTEQAFQGSLAGSADAFVATLSPLGTALEYATYMGGSGFDQGMALVLDSDGNRYLAGRRREPRNSRLPGKSDSRSMPHER